MSADLPSFVRSLFPAAGAELRALHQSVIDNDFLLPLDFLSIQDLLAVSNYGDHESLHVLLLLMFLALEEGSLCIETSQAALTARLSVLAGAEQAEHWGPRIVADLAEGRFPRLIGATAEEVKPLLLCGAAKQYLYFHKYLRGETALQGELQKRLRKGPQLFSGEDDWQPILRQVLHERPLQLGSGPLQLDAAQTLALERCLTTNFVIVSGGPGTGKTSLVLTLLRCLMRNGVRPEQIALAAPTGRAAQRLTDSLNAGLERIAPAPGEHDLPLRSLQAGTLHQLLEYSSSRGMFYRHRENPLTADVVIVDEVSMVGVVLMAQLLQALRPRCKLILLGDKDQLPSVEAGAVLANLVGAAGAEPPDYVVLLETNHRSQPAIQEAAAAINRQDTSVVERLPVPKLSEENGQPSWWQTIASERGCWLLQPPAGGTGPAAQTIELHRVLQRWAAQHFLGSYVELVRGCELFPGAEDDPAVVAKLRELFRVLESNRVLTLVREGAFGCVGVNQHLDGLLRPSLDRGSRGHLFAGAPVLITANDHLRRLYNGDVGVVLRSADAGPTVNPSLRAVFPRRGGFESFALESLPGHELGLALTVHKSQGSEYDRVLLVLPPAGARRLLTREILYTGVTRAREMALIVGTRETMRLAIGRTIVRASGLSYRFDDPELIALGGTP